MPKMSDVFKTQKSEKTLYHLTPDDLGSNVILQPKKPLNPSAAEDRTTLRVSLCPTIEGCMLGLQAWNGKFFVYEVKGEGLEIFRPRGGLGFSDIGTKKNPYRGVVSDADKTGEVWSLVPVHAKKIGQIEINKNGEEGKDRLTDLQVGVTRYDWVHDG